MMSDLMKRIGNKSGWHIIAALLFLAAVLNSISCVSDGSIAFCGESWIAWWFSYLNAEARS